MHYQRWRKTGNPGTRLRAWNKTPEDALKARSEPDGDCVVWTGPRNKDGYGRMHAWGRHTFAHRVAWQLAQGPLDEATHLDHICHNRACIKVEHLRLTNRQLNAEYKRGARSDSRSGIRGAVWSSYHQQYRAMAHYKGKRYYAGRFDNARDAGDAAAALRERLYGSQ